MMFLLIFQCKVPSRSASCCCWRLMSLLSLILQSPASWTVPSWRHATSPLGTRGRTNCMCPTMTTSSSAAPEEPWLDLQVCGVNVWIVWWHCQLVVKATLWDTLLIISGAHVVSQLTGLDSETLLMGEERDLCISRFCLTLTGSNMKDSMRKVFGFIVKFVTSVSVLLALFSPVSSHINELCLSVSGVGDHQWMKPLLLVVFVPSCLVWVLLTFGFLFLVSVSSFGFTSTWEQLWSKVY